MAYSVLSLLLLRMIIIIVVATSHCVTCLLIDCRSELFCADTLVVSI